MNTKANNAADDAAEGLPDFHSTPWQVLIGVRSLPPAIIDFRMVITPLAVLNEPKEGVPVEPDRTIPAVHFADWVNRNQSNLISLWQTEYATYMNLKRATSAEKTVRDIGLVDAGGLSLRPNQLN